MPFNFITSINVEKSPNVSLSSVSDNYRLLAQTPYSDDNWQINLIWSFIQQAQSIKTNISRFDK